MTESYFRVHFIYGSRKKLVITLDEKKVPVPESVQCPTEKSNGQHKGKNLSHLILGLRKVMENGLWKDLVQHGRMRFYYVHWQTNVFENMDI